MENGCKRRLALLFAFVFVDVLGFSLILPLLPYYAEIFAATPTIVGLLLGTNAATQFIGAPIIGRLSDRYGRRPLLILSIAGTVVSFVMLGLANSLGMLFASRILDGLLGGNVSLPGILGALLMGLLIPFVWQRVLFVPDLVCPEPILEG